MMVVGMSERVARVAVGICVRGTSKGNLGFRVVLVYVRVFRANVPHNDDIRARPPGSLVS